MSKLFWISMFLILIPGRFLADQTAISLDNKEPIELAEGWQLRWGDSPKNEQGMFTWLYQKIDHPEWKRLDHLNNLPDNPGEHYLWYKLTLPEEKYYNPAIYISHIAVNFQIYLQDKLIYSFDEFKGKDQSKYAICRSYIIPLPDNYSTTLISFRIQSDRQELLGIETHAESILLGSQQDVIRYIVKHNLDSIVLGFLYIALGIFSLFVFAKRFADRPFYLSSFGIFVFFIGLYYITFDHATLVFIRASRIMYYTGFLSFLIFPVGLFSFLDSIIGGNLIVRRIWQFHLIYVPIALILDLADVALFIQSQQVYFILFIVTILLSVAVGVRAALRGNWEARIFIAGFSILVLFGVHDILVGYDIIPAWHWMSQWGTFIFIIFLAFILENKFSETQKRLREYSEKLEEKVRVRTSELYQKNRQLESTLKELKDMQNRLIIKEKMASLGNLIAGVAHEMNNPIGAMNSAGHVLQKSLEKIQTKLKQAGSIQHLKDDRQLGSTLDLMRDNNNIVVMGSKRVSEIVKSLRTFARLDEAEFQDADIHQGLNDTLTLLYHEIKNKIEIEKEYGNLPKIKCYPNQLNQVFMNILINSIQAIEGKGIIKIRTLAEKNRIKIKISDNGRGIPEKNIQKIFDPGFTTKGVGVGTGLGLSISYNIIQKHKGTINVASEHGKGTSFEIILPNNLEKEIESSHL